MRMKDFKEVEFFLEPLIPGRDVLIAALAEQSYDSFEETESGFKAYITEDLYDESVVKDIISQYSSICEIEFTSGDIESVNWNEEWEKNYPPVLVDDLCLVKAPFHDIKEDVEFELLIEPKMSFGTAHHDTTHLMIQWLLELRPEGKSVLDMGCGTGVLAILAQQMNASRVTAIDNYVWAYENTKENAERNNTAQMNVIHGDAEVLGDESFDLIIANINRNVLMDDIPAYIDVLNDNGQMIISGFFRRDADMLTDLSKKHGLEKIGEKYRNDWASILFEKK